MRSSSLGTVPVLLVGFAVASITVTTRAASRPTPAAEPVGDGAAPDVGSPRGAIAAFLDAARRGDHARAAAHLNLAPEEAVRGSVLARRLKTVLDRHVWFDLEELSDSAEGRLDDGLAPDLELVGRVVRPDGRADPVNLRRIDSEGLERWVFSRSTVAQIDGWYGTLGNRWLLDHLPPSLLLPGPRDVPWWQWGALVLLAPFAWAVGLVAARVAASRLARVAARTSATWDDALAERLRGPLRLGASLAVASLALPTLGLYAPAVLLAHRIIRAGALVVLFWGALRAVSVGGQVLSASAWGRAHPAARSLLPVALRTARVAVVLIAAVAILSELGYPVTSLLVGLGVGGLAVALAAQKTVENLFGAIAIGADQPFREGDFVRVEDFVGTVECIGLRSTRIRTLDRTLVSIPNGRLADMRTESFAARDRIRLACTIGLVYATTGRQMRDVLEGLERTLRSHPKIWPDAVVVRFKEFGASSLDIEVMAWFTTDDWGEFQRIRQEILLEFMDVVERAGSSFAFPTRTVHVVAERPEPPRNEVADASSLLRGRMRAVDGK